MTEQQLQTRQRKIIADYKQSVANARAAYRELVVRLHDGMNERLTALEEEYAADWAVEAERIDTNNINLVLRVATIYRDCTVERLLKSNRTPFVHLRYWIAARLLENGFNKKTISSALGRTNAWYHNTMIRHKLLLERDRHYQRMCEELDGLYARECPHIGK